MTSRDDTPLDEEARAHLQQRVALFGQVMTAIGAAGLAIDVLARLADEGLGGLAPPLLTGLATAGAAGTWLSCRTGRRSVRFCRVAEATGLLFSTACVLLVGRHLVPLVVAQAGGVDLATLPVDDTSHALVVVAEIFVLMNLIVGLTHEYVIRAALVPTSPRHTALLTAGLAFPFMIAFSFGAVPFRVEGLVGRFARPADDGRIVAQAVIWWGFTIAVCTVISQVIYGLRRELRAVRRLGQYQLEEKLGEGGMGIVYRARHALMRRPTAVKLLPPDRAGGINLERFEREVRLTARLTHPNTITVYDYGRTPDGLFYYAMELLDGANLDTVVEVDGPQPPARVARVMAQVADALAEAHGVGLIHRDVKPGNVFLCERGGIPDVAKLLDFGLVKTTRGGPDAVSLTRDDAVTGTPLYMAPESLTDPEAVDARSDLYALGAVAWFLLTGAHVFSGRTAVEVLGHHLHTAPEPPSARLGRPVPEPLEALVLACLAKDPADRPASARALVEALEATGLPAAWTRSDAGTWWDRHRAALHRAVSRAVPPAATLDVDLLARRARASDVPPSRG